MQRLQMLNEISRVLSSRLDLDRLYDTIYEQMSRVMDTSMFFLALSNGDGANIHIPYVREFGSLARDVTSPAGPSVTTHVWERRQPLLFRSADEYEQYAVAHSLPVIVLGDSSRGHPQSMIYAPLDTEDRTIGTLSVQSTRRDAYTQDDVYTVTVIAAQAAIAIQNARLYEASVESWSRRHTLLRVAEVVNSSLELPSVLGAILDSINEVMPYHLAAILLPNKATKNLDTVGAVGHMSERRRQSMKIPMGSGVTGRVFESGEALVVDDVTKFPGYIRGSSKVRSEVAVPLKHGDSVVGVLNVERSEKAAFSPADVDLLLLFATQAAIAIENARLFEAQRNRVDELQAIQSLVQEMTGLNEFQAMAALIERGLVKLMEFDECTILMVNDETRMVEPVLLQGDDGRKRRGPRRARPIGEGISGWVAEHGQSTIFDSTKTDPRVTPDVSGQDWEMTVVGVPLMYHNKVCGVLTVGKLGASSLDETHVRILEIIAAHAAIGFDRCRLYDELRRQATTDELTGLYNRRYLLERLREEISRAHRNDHPLAAVMIDADEFKRVNDLYGHDAGDAVLRELARLLREQVRTEDIVARYGGEEFLILLPEVGLEDARPVAERLRHLISSTRLVPESGVDHIEVSVGVAELSSSDVAEDLITRADHAMYEAKRAGGNQLCTWHNGVFELVKRPLLQPVRQEAA